MTFFQVDVGWRILITITHNTCLNKSSPDSFLTHICRMGLMRQLIYPRRSGQTNESNSQVNPSIWTIIPSFFLLFSHITLFNSEYYNNESHIHQITNIRKKTHIQTKKILLTQLFSPLPQRINNSEFEDLWCCPTLPPVVLGYLSVTCSSFI